MFYRVFRDAVLLIALLASAQSHAAQVQAQVAAPKGTLVIIGGGLRGDNAAVWSRIVQLAGGEGARIAVFGAASYNAAKAGDVNAARLNQYGAKAFAVPIGRGLPDTADDPELADAIRKAGGAYFAGGDQARITRALRRPDGSNTKVLDALWEMYRRGGVIAGTSAGAAIMSSTMFYRADTVLSTLRQGVEEGNEIAPGLGFIGDDVFVDQHLLIRGRFARMLPAMLKKGYKLGLGIDENTAMVVGADREVEVLGYRGALLLDMTEASTQDGGEFNVSNVKLSYLDNGDRFNLASGAITPGRDKADGKLNPSRPYYKGPLFTADILANSAVTDLMARLIDSDQLDAIGVAMSSPFDKKSDLGFEFRLSRVQESVGYQSPLTDAYSIYKLRLDIRPIAVRQPMYQYRNGSSQDYNAAQSNAR
ncbi:cyanophycinase [Massilia soli]|uniref:Cyanophycinase n=1 Tax=Massilia soli TaxID=2792854 RepID=A0ABS7SNX9_9BURK|nr:cyanophycinase [Massilia soli]MBZ2207794.1 cyanophycinase [Massilia soli]